MISLLTLAAAAILAAPQEKPKPAKEHEWLNQLAGDWTTEAEIAAPEKGKEPTKAKGTARSRMFGGFWLVLESKGEVAGSPFIGQLTVGWDADAKKFVGTWIDTMHPRMWHYTGTVAGSTLALEAEGPSFEDPSKKAKYRDSFEIKEKDLIVLTSSVEQDGKWATYLTVQYRRKVEGMTSSEPPPAPKAEEVKARAGFIWIGGYWTLNGGKWEWLDGHWERERAGFIYLQGRWEKSGELFRWVPGEWKAVK